MPGKYFIVNFGFDAGNINAGSVERDGYLQYFNAANPGGTLRFLTFVQNYKVDDPIKKATNAIREMYKDYVEGLPEPCSPEVCLPFYRDPSTRAPSQPNDPNKEMILNTHDIFMGPFLTPGSFSVPNRKTGRCGVVPCRR